MKLKRSKLDKLDMDSEPGGPPPKLRKKKRKRGINDLSLPPLKGTYNPKVLVMLRSESSSRATTETELSGMLKSEALDERRTWNEEDGNVREKLKMSRRVVEKLNKLNRYMTCACASLSLLSRGSCF